MLVGSVSCVGLFSSGFYDLETINWQAQTIGQDFMDASFLTPSLLLCAFLAYRGNKTQRNTNANLQFHAIQA